MWRNSGRFGNVVKEFISHIIIVFLHHFQGTTVDVALYPLDTVKTRLQSSQGFLKSGGFKSVYKGLSITAIGSAPGAALFFSTYEKVKQILASQNLPQPINQMIAASSGEMVSTVLL